MRRLRVVKGRVAPRTNRLPGVQYPLATPQQLAGSTITQTTTDPNRVKLAPGMAIQYDANGKPIGFVRINQSDRINQVGIAQGKGISYDASGKPSVVDFPATGSSGGSGGTGGSTTGIGPNEVRTLSPGTVGDSYYQEATGPSGILGSVDRAVGSRNASDQAYLIQMGYTPEQAAQAIRSRSYDITDPSNPTGTKISRDIGSLEPGALDWNQVDVSNPYSRAGMLVKSYRGAVQGTTTGMAAGGHGRSGAALTAQQGNSFNFGSGQNQINQDLQNYVTGSTEARTGIGYEANQGINRALLDFISDPNRNKTTNMTWGGNYDTQGLQGTNQTSAPAQGNYIYGAQAAKDAGLLAPGISLGNGWSIEVKDGKVVRFIPPGGA